MRSLLAGHPGGVIGGRTGDLAEHVGLAPAHFLARARSLCARALARTLSALGVAPFAVDARIACFARHALFKSADAAVRGVLQRRPRLHAQSLGVNVLEPLFNLLRHNGTHVTGRTASAVHTVAVSGILNDVSAGPAKDGPYFSVAAAGTVVAVASDGRAQVDRAGAYFGKTLDRIACGHL